MRKVGCQPPWRRFNVTGLPVCDEWTSLHDYSRENAKLATVVRNEMMNITNCLMPCTFMEYKVCLVLVSILDVSIVLKCYRYQRHHLRRFRVTAAKALYHVCPQTPWKFIERRRHSLLSHSLLILEVSLDCS